MTIEPAAAIGEHSATELTYIRPDLVASYADDSLDTVQVVAHRNSKRYMLSADMHETGEGASVEFDRAALIAFRDALTAELDRDASKQHPALANAIANAIIDVNGFTLLSSRYAAADAAIAVLRSRDELDGLDRSQGGDAR